MVTDSDVALSDLRELLTILGMGDHPRPQSPHEVFQEALGVLRARLAPPCEDDITQAMIQAGRHAANLNDGTLAGIYLAMRGAEPWGRTGAAS